MHRWGGNVLAEGRCGFDNQLLCTLVSKCHSHISFFLRTCQEFLKSQLHLDHNCFLSILSHWYTFWNWAKLKKISFKNPKLKPNHSPVNTWDLAGWVVSKLCSSSGGSAQSFMGDGETLRSHIPWLERNQVSYYNHSKWIMESLKDEQRTSEWFFFLKSEDIITYFSKETNFCLLLVSLFQLLLCSFWVTMKGTESSLSFQL